MLHWLYVLTFILASLVICLAFLAKSLLALLLIGEVSIIVVYFCGLLLASYMNIYYLLGLSFFFLVLGGLELVLNLLITMLG